jgi:hypothetical protein
MQATNETPYGVKLDALEGVMRAKLERQYPSVNRRRSLSPFLTFSAYVSKQTLRKQVMF